MSVRSSRPRPSLMHTKQTLLLGIACATLMLWTWHLFGSEHPSKPLWSSAPAAKKTRYWSMSENGELEGLETWTRPSEIDKIVAIIFYGRPATVSILDCYLKVWVTID